MSEVHIISAAEVRTIEVITTEIRVIQQQSQQVILGYAIELGRRLVEAKAMLGHGEWGPWLKEEVNFSQSTANNFMRIFQEYGASQIGLFGGEANSQTLGNLPYTKALKLLAMPEEEREEFVQENDVEHMSTRELDAVIRERDEAKKKAEEADEAAQQLQEQAEEYKRQLAELEEQEREVDERAAAAEEELSELRRQLEELQSAPAEVAVEPVVDEKAVKAAAKEAKEAAEKKLKAKIEKAEQEKAKAEQELSAAKVEREEAKAVAEREKQLLSEQVQTLQKKLAVASSSEMTVFKLHFEHTQESINKMTACICTMRENGDSDGAEKLNAALSALLRSTLEVLG